MLNSDLIVMAGCTPWLSGPGFTPGFFVAPCLLGAPSRREDDDDRTRLHPIHENVAGVN